VPKVVDHDARREKLLEASWNVIVRLGLDKTTIRELAKESGFSHGTWAYYFTDKDDILASALRLQHKRIEARMFVHVAKSQGLEALRFVMLESLPLDEQRLLEAQIEMNFWVRAMTTDTLREAVVSDLQGFRKMLKRLVREARQLDEIKSTLSDDEIISELMVLIDALSVEAVLSPDLTLPKRQMAMLNRLLERFADPRLHLVRTRETGLRAVSGGRARQRR
jgi:AcrR family transcriptional regulator